MSWSLHQVGKADDTTLIAEREEELKSLLMRVNEENYFTMYFFNKYCLTVYYGPGTIVDTECTAISRQNCLFLELAMQTTNKKAYSVSGGEK